MARRHWLDPLARRLLVASGQLPAPAVADPQRSGSAFGLLGRRSAASSAGLPQLEAAAAAGRAAAADHPEDAAHQEAVERDLLALKLTQNPGLRLRDAEEVRHAAALGWRLDVNRATAGDWIRLPGCTAHQADLLQRLQAGGVQLSGPDDLREVLGLQPATLTSWLPLLVFRWYGDASAQPSAPSPVAVNQAAAAALERLPGLTPERARRLLRERSRAPFRDLADLGERLALPPSVLEGWIGRVSFAPGPSGPVLPPSPQRQAGTAPPGTTRAGGRPAG